MARTLPRQPLILPSAPTDEERDTYFKRNAWLLAACGLTGTLGATWATAHMAISHDGMSIVLPIVLASFICLITSYALVSKTRDAKVSSHRTRALNWKPDHYQSVDVWLPVCNEPLALLSNAWSHTCELEWPAPPLPHHDRRVRGRVRCRLLSASRFPARADAIFRRSQDRHRPVAAVFPRARRAALARARRGSRPGVLLSLCADHTPTVE